MGDSLIEQLRLVKDFRTKDGRRHPLTNFLPLGNETALPSKEGLGDLFCVSSINIKNPIIMTGLLSGNNGAIFPKGLVIEVKYKIDALISDTTPKLSIPENSLRILD